MIINKLDFFIPIKYENQTTFNQYIIEGIEDYFYLGGKCAYVIPGDFGTDSQAVEIKPKDTSKFQYVILTALKIISYMTVAIPLIMLGLKIVIRNTHQFHIKNNDTVHALMNKFTQFWDEEKLTFDFPENDFNLESFTQLLREHAQKFKKDDLNYEEHFGYIEKFDLDPSQNPQIYMRADLHGDLKSLIENLRSLQELHLLDQNYKCKEGVHLVFLGDYCDRGVYGTQILEMLMRLREENPNQIHLIRGNHEYNMVNNTYAASDRCLMKVLSNKDSSDALENFYETMSLTTYFSLDGQPQREYVQCTHGLFEPTMDAAPLLDEKSSGAHLPVPKQRTLSERVRKIACGDDALAKSAERVQKIVEASRNLEKYLTAYNWGDVSKEHSELNTLGNRQYKLNAKDIRHCLDLSSEQHRVMMIFRGHQHKFQHLMHEEKVLATTLPVGMDSAGYKDSFKGQPDRAYIIKPANKVEDWKKRAILRESGHSNTDEITDRHLLTSSSI